MFQDFVGQVISVESTDAQGPVGVKLTLARAPIKAAGQDEVGPTTQDPEYFSTVSVRVWCHQRVWFNTRASHYCFRFECTPNTKLWNMKHEWLYISKSQFIPSVCTFEAFSLALAANADMRSLHVHSQHLVVSSTSSPLLWTYTYRAINSLCGLTCLISACLMNSTVKFMYIRQIKQYGHNTKVL